MNGKERMRLAFQHREADRVPCCEQAFASDVASAIFGRPMYTGTTSLHYEEARAWMNGDEAHREFEEKLWADFTALTRSLEFDAVSVPWRMQEKPARRIDEFTFFYGDETRRARWAVYRFDPASQHFGQVDSWNKQQQPDDIPGLVAEMARSRRQRLPLTQASFPALRKLLDTFGDELTVLGGGGISIPCTPDWLQAIILHEAAVGEYLDIQTENTLECIRIQAEMGIRIIWGGSDLAGKNGPFYSPMTFHELVLPRLKRIVALCNSLGISFLFRSDGNLWPVAEDLFIASGIHGLGEIEGDAGMDLGKLKQKYGHLTFWGNLSCHLLRTGTKAEVIKATKKCIDQAAEGGGYILGTSNSVLPGTPPENVVAMYETAREYGKYHQS